MIATPQATLALSKTCALIKATTRFVTVTACLTSCSSDIGASQRRHVAVAENFNRCSQLFKLVSEPLNPRIDMSNLRADDLGKLQQPRLNVVLPSLRRRYPKPKVRGSSPLGTANIIKDLVEGGL
jgi:hypothetical protein